MSNRKEATEFILTYIDKILPDGKNRALYTDYFNNISDEEFSALMDKLESGEEILKLICPNGNDVKLSVERNLSIAKELKHDFFEHLILTDQSTGVVYKTPKKYLTGLLPVRRQAQTLINKVSIPEHNNTTDQLTDQPTGPSKGSKISMPELQVIYAQGMDKTITELIKYRGGDRKGYGLMNRLIMREGGVRQETLSRFPTKVKSTMTLGSILYAQHLDNNV